MSRTSSFLKYWLPVLAWMAVIFSASTGAMSSRQTSRFIGPLVRWLIPNISDAAVGEIVYVTRKTAHVTEYAVLALLCWRAWHKPRKDKPQPWRWSEAVLATMVAALYAASDEIHQAFVPTREARFGDVLLDTIGAVIGLLGLWTVGRWRRKW